MARTSLREDSEDRIDKREVLPEMWDVDHYVRSGISVITI